MKKWIFGLIAVLLVLAMVLVACVKAPVGAKPIKIGLIAPLTGIAADVGPRQVNGANYILDKYGWEVAGRKIELIVEDEGGDLDVALAKAKKLVEQDKVDVVVGAMLEFISAAVASYTTREGVIQIYPAVNDLNLLDNELSFMPGGSARRQSAVAGGYFAYDELGLRRAAIITADHSYGHTCAIGFIDGFLERGGTISSIQLVPLSAADTAPYLSRIEEDVDCIAGFMCPPFSLSLPKQVREYGLDIPILFQSIFGIEDPILEFIGDDVVGHYGFTHYTWTLDTPENKEFVSEYLDKYGYYPCTSDLHGYQPMVVYLEALKATGGDTSRDKVVEALKNLGRIDTPEGPIVMTPERVGIMNQYAVQIEKVEGRTAFKVLKEYPLIEPDWRPCVIEDAMKLVTP